MPEITPIHPHRTPESASGRCGVRRALAPPALHPAQRGARVAGSARECRAGFRHAAKTGERLLNHQPLHTCPPARSSSGTMWRAVSGTTCEERATVEDNCELIRLFVSQAFVDTDAGGSTGWDPTGYDRKGDDDPKPDPNAVSGGVVFRGEVDHLS
jgi:hypothetical protein